MDYPVLDIERIREEWKSVIDKNPRLFSCYRVSLGIFHRKQIGSFDYNTVLHVSFSNQWQEGIYEVCLEWDIRIGEFCVYYPMQYVAWSNSAPDRYSLSRVSGRNIVLRYSSIEGALNSVRRGLLLQSELRTE